MLILVVQQWLALLVDWQQGTHATKKSCLSEINFILPGVTNAVLENQDQQRW